VFTKRTKGFKKHAKKKKKPYNQTFHLSFLTPIDFLLTSLTHFIEKIKQNKQNIIHISVQTKDRNRDLNHHYKQTIIRSKGKDFVNVFVQRAPRTVTYAIKFDVMKERGQKILTVYAYSFKLFQVGPG